MMRKVKPHGIRDGARFFFFFAHLPEWWPANVLILQLSVAVLNVKLFHTSKPTCFYTHNRNSKNVGTLCEIKIKTEYSNLQTNWVYRQFYRFFFGSVFLSQCSKILDTIIYLSKRQTSLHPTRKPMSITRISFSYPIMILTLLPINLFPYGIFQTGDFWPFHNFPSLLLSCPNLFRNWHHIFTKINEGKGEGRDKTLHILSLYFLQFTFTFTWHPNYFWIRVVWQGQRMGNTVHKYSAWSNHPDCFSSTLPL